MQAQTNSVIDTLDIQPTVYLQKERHVDYVEHDVL